MRATLCPPICLLLGLLGATSMAVSAQVTARQGVASPPEIVHFASPMILELPLPNVGRLGPGAKIELPGTRKYVCDNDVRLLGLAVAKKYKGPRKARSLELVLSGLVVVGDSYDRRSDIAVRLKSGDAILASQWLRNLKTEEERNTPFQVVLPIAEAALAGAFAAEAPPLLELTLVVRDDS